MARAPGTRALLAFRQTMLTGSVTGAAAALGRTQPAVSRLLKDLQADLGFALFERVRGRLVATAEARLFFEEVQRSFQGLDRLATVAGEIRQGRRGTLRLAAMPAATAFLPEALARFAEAAPGVAVELLVQPSVEVARLVQTQACDLGIVEGSTEAPAVSVLRRHALRCAVIGPPGHRFPARRAPRLADLHGQPFVALSPLPLSVGAQLAALLVREGIEPRIAVHTQLSGTVSALVMRGLGLGVVDEPTAVLHRAQGGAARPLEAPLAMPVRFLRAAGLPATARLRELIALADQAIASHKLS
jgi:DNA-binding transcriptional LysR family regulator